MFQNVGAKIKGLVSVVTWFEIIIFVILGIVVMVAFPNASLLGLIIMAAGTFLAWISSLMLYSWGQLVDNTDKLVNELCKAESSYSDNDKLSTLIRWRTEGLITEEEYQKKLREIGNGVSK